MLPSRSRGSMRGDVESFERLNVAQACLPCFAMQTWHPFLRQTVNNHH